MTSTIFLIVILAAVLHAGWNALVKGGADKTAAMVAVVLGQGLSGALLLPFTPSLTAAAYPYLAASVALHIGYQLFLVAAYKIGDLTQVYPIARGASPLLVTAASILFLGVTFSREELAAIGLIALGIASISLTRRADGVFQLKAAVLALVTGMFIAAYSMIDGIGARLGGTGTGFFALSALINGSLFLVFTPVIRPGLMPRVFKEWRVMIIGGGASFTAYVLVVYAFTQAPIALVTALRETSIIFALFIGVFVLKERLSLMKVLSTALTLGGAAMLRFYRN